MSGGSLEFDKRALRRVREEIPKSPALAAEHDRQKKARRLSIWIIVLAAIGTIVGLLMIVVVLPGVLLIAIAKQFNGPFLLGMGSLVLTVATLAFSEALVRLLENSRTVTVASHLPESDADIAGTVWAELAGWFCISSYFAMYVAGVAAWEMQLGPLGWTLALSLGALQTAVLIAFGTILAVNRPRWPFAEAAGAIAILTVGLYIGCAWVGPGQGPAAVADTLFLCTPAGWVNAGLVLGLVGGRITGWLALAAAGLIVGFLYPALKYLKANYHIASFEVEGTERARANVVGPMSRGERKVAESDPEWSDAIEQLDLLYAGRRPPARPDDPDAVPHSVRLAESLQPRSRRDMGLVERIVYRFLKPRERVIIEFLCAEHTNWSRMLKVAALSLACVLPVVMLFDLDGVLFMVTLGVGFSCLSGPWNAMFRRNAGGTYMAMWSAYPLEYRETFRALYKVGAVRCFLAMPLAMAGLALPLVLQRAPRELLLLSGPLWYVTMLVLQNWTVTWNLSGFFSMPSFRWRRLPLYFPPFLAGLLQLGGIGAFVAAFDMGPGLRDRWMLIGILLTLLGSFGIRYYFQWMHRRGLLDPVVLNLSKDEENRQTFAEKTAERDIRSRLAREHHGRFWWRERALRKWVWSGE